MNRLDQFFREAASVTLTEDTTLTLDYKSYFPNASTVSLKKNNVATLNNLTLSSHIQTLYLDGDILNSFEDSSMLSLERLYIRSQSFMNLSGNHFGKLIHIVI